jgi:benzoyl-CoA reductase/2-hydroxyglutaryl-CoA dehydratase subunit BcrC/BadD/HgdB
MFRTMLQAMEQRTGLTFRETGAAAALWYNEWAKLGLRAYEADRKVVYTSAYAFPMEILAAFDVVPFDFELASGMITATDMGVPTMVEAEELGYSPDVCSFHRTALGASHLEYFPKPEILLTASYYCDGKAKTNEILSILHNRESILLQVPAAVDKTSMQYVEKQLREITRRIGEAVGQEPDEDRLKEAVRSSNRARRSQRKMLELLKHRPGPWGGRELISFSINSLLFTGNEIKERLNDAFAEEMERRIEAGELRPESHRVYWFAWIPTYPCDVFSILKENEVAVPLCETFEIYWDEMDEENPFEGLALRCLKNPLVGPGARRTERMETIADDYHLEGAILFATPACRTTKTACRLLRDSMAKQGLPFLVLDMDIGDPRYYSRGQTRTRLEAFIEMLEQRKQ